MSKPWSDCLTVFVMTPLPHFTLCCAWHFCSNVSTPPSLLGFIPLKFGQRWPERKACYISISSSVASPLFCFRSFAPHSNVQLYAKNWFLEAVFQWIVIFAMCLQSPTLKKIQCYYKIQCNYPCEWVILGNFTFWYVTLNDIWTRIA